MTFTGSKQRFSSRVAENQQGGVVSVDYITRIYFAQLMGKD